MSSSPPPPSCRTQNLILEDPNEQYYIQVFKTPLLLTVAVIQFQILQSCCEVWVILQLGRSAQSCTWKNISLPIRPHEYSIRHLIEKSATRLSHSLQNLQSSNYTPGNHFPSSRLPQYKLLGSRVSKSFAIFELCMFFFKPDAE